MDDLHTDTLPGTDALGAPLVLDPDPAPGKRGRGRPRKGSAPAAAPAKRTSSTRSTPTRSRAATTAAQLAQIRDELETYLLLAAGAGSLRCESCGAAAEEAVPRIAEKAAALIGRNPALVAKFSTGTMLADVFGLVMAVMPVARAVYSHHGPGSAHQHGEAEVTGADPYAHFRAYSPAGAVG